MDLQRVKFQLKKKTSKIYQKPELTGNSLTPVVMWVLIGYHYKLIFT